MNEPKEVERDVEASTRPKATWTTLSMDHIDSLVNIADKIHPGLPESREVFAERVRLFPEGCLALIDNETNELGGYAISHPIHFRQLPNLNCLMGEIPPDAGQYYVHDLVILPKLRGRGFAQECIDKLSVVAKNFPTSSLVSVYGTASFWSRFGFVPKEVDESLKEKLLDYGDDAIYLERRN